MKRLIPKQKAPLFNNSIEYLHHKTQSWVSEIEFIKIEQDFLKEILAEHIVGLCDSNLFPKAKLFLNGVNHEKELGQKLIESINLQKVNLSLLIEGIYLKKEKIFRENQALLRIEYKNYIENFRYIKEQVFEIVLFILNQEKLQKSLKE